MDRKPRTQGEQNFVDAAKQVLKDKNGEWFTRSDTAEMIDDAQENVSYKSALSHLSTYRDYLEEETPLETKDVGDSPGNPTVHWRYNK